MVERKSATGRVIGRIAKSTWMRCWPTRTHSLIHLEKGNLGMTIDLAESRLLVRFPMSIPHSKLRIIPTTKQSQSDFVWSLCDCRRGIRKYHWSFPKARTAVGMVGFNRQRDPIVGFVGTLVFGILNRHVIPVDDSPGCFRLLAIRQLLVRFIVWKRSECPVAGPPNRIFRIKRLVDLEKVNNSVGGICRPE